jgi:hypothetical protein
LIGEVVKKLVAMQSHRTPFSRAHRVLTRVALIIAATLLTQGSTIASGDATTGHFSQRQISSYIQTVTSELQLSKNWQSNFGTPSAGSLYCSSSLLGEGVRAGIHGLYTWFTCSAMHKIDLASSTKDSLTCTGFSSPVWIQPGLNTVTYQAITSESEFAALKLTAPGPIQTALDATYNQVNQKSTRIVVGRAIGGNSPTSKSTGPSSFCQ